MPDTETETYDVWVINDADGPVLYFPVPSSSAAPPGEHVARHRQHAARASAPDGLIEGVWSRARQRLAASGASLVAEIADPEVETRRAAQRAATMARGADAVAWAPEELLAEPEPAPRKAPKKKASKRTASRPASSGSARTARTAGTRSARPRPAPKKPAPASTPTEPEERMCPSCFMMRSVDQFPEGSDVCEFCA